MEQRNNSFGNGFVLGAIIGAAIALLLATERGRKILKVLTEEGWERAQELRDLVEEVEEEVDEEEALGQEDALDVEVPKSQATQQPKTATPFAHPVAEKKVKHFFKGLPRK